MFDSVVTSKDIMQREKIKAAEQEKILVSPLILLKTLRHIAWESLNQMGGQLGSMMNQQLGQRLSVVPILNRATIQ